jgi:hypothetical protein
MSGSVEAARRKFAEAERGSDTKLRVSCYLEASRLFLLAAQAATDQTTARSLLYFSNLSAGKSSSLASTTSLVSTRSEVSDDLEIGVLSERLIFKAHLGRIENLSKVKNAILLPLMPC